MPQEDHTNPTVAVLYGPKDVLEALADEIGQEDEITFNRPLFEAIMESDYDVVVVEETAALSEHLEAFKDAVDNYIMPDYWFLDQREYNTYKEVME